MQATSLLQLEDYVFDQVVIRATDGPVTGDVAVRVNVQVNDTEGTPHSWQVTLDVEVAQKEGVELPPPYQVQLRALAIFVDALPDDVSEDDRRDLIGINGGSILYSAARELVMMVTGRGPHGPLKLPTIRLARTAPPAEPAAAAP